MVLNTLRSRVQTMRKVPIVNPTLNFGISLWFQIWWRWTTLDSLHPFLRQHLRHQCRTCRSGTPPASGWRRRHLCSRNAGKEVNLWETLLIQNLFQTPYPDQHFVKLWYSNRDMYSAQVNFKVSFPNSAGVWPLYP